jgi:hypothetical protein
MTPEEEKVLKQKLEKEGMQSVETIHKSIINKEHDLQVTAKTYQNIIAKGVEEFTKKTGRQMTYGEMREMYG